MADVISYRGTKVAPSGSSPTMAEMEEINQSRSQWADQRRKMGVLTKRQSKLQDIVLTYDERRNDLINTIQDSVKRKECIRFVPKKDPKRKDGDPIVCHCGEVPEKHIKNAAGVTDFFRKGIDMVEKELAEGKFDKTDWNPEKDIAKIPTNSFGKIEFVNQGVGGTKPAKYLRIADDTSVDTILDIMIDNWRMLEPRHANLVITVIGGAKNFKLDGKKKEIFNRGLVNAAQTTSAWIITSGCNMGVMKAVGEAVREGQTFTWDKMGMTHSLRCVGIAPWGYIERKEALISKDGFGLWNARYKVNNVIRHGHPVSLNPDHTHFLLIDDGHRGRYAGVADFRASLERKLSLPSDENQNGECGLGIPVVLVVVEGGYDALLDVRKSLTQKIPVVICEGTGRAADIIAYAYTHHVTTRKGERMLNDKHKLILEDKLRAAYGKTWASRGDEQKEVDKFIGIIMECCEDEKLITVFDMNKNEGDLDLAILSALLKGQGASNVSQMREQLKLALTWDRSDVAEEKIFRDNIMWPTGYLDEIMTEALIDNKVNFVKLLLQNGVVMKEYLTIPRLRKLYNYSPKTSHLRQLLEHKCKRTIFTLKDVDRLIRKLASQHDDDIYQSDNDINIVIRNENAYAGEYENFVHPFRELFLWAVLMNRQEMALFLWERGDEAIPSALTASRIFASLADKVAHYDSDLRNSYLKHKDQFEKLAVRVLEECHKTDPEKAGMLIERNYPTWGEINCLEMAAQAVDREFLSTVCCQNSLNIMWKRGIVSSWPKVWLALLFPPVIWCGLKFQTLGSISDTLSAWEKFRTYYTAPVTKFYANLMMYCIFLLLYSYMILFGFKEQVTEVEMATLIWMGTFCLDEFRAMFHSSSAESNVQRLKDWWQFSIFNKLDFFIMCLFFLCLILRFTLDFTVQVKAVYAINLICLFIRILNFYSASSNLGPKLVMITKMFQELVLYIMILLVFLLAYGISIHALMYPTRAFYIGIFKDIFYYPYWQIYGELYLEETEGRTDECLTTNTTGVVRSDGSPCPQFSWLVPGLTAIYLLIGNILLLNLLIAIFNNVFEEVETNSIQIWKYGMYYLVIEYEKKPGLAPPFIVFEHIFLVIRWICKKCCKSKFKEKGGQYTSRQVELLQTFEKEMMRSYVRKRGNEERGTADTYIYKILSRVDEMAKILEEERLLEQQHYEAEQNKRALHDAMKRHGVPYSQIHRDSLCDTPNLSREGTLVTQESLLARKPFAKWPSLQRINELQENLKSIKEEDFNKSNEANDATSYTESTDQDERRHKTYYVKLAPPKNDPNINKHGEANNLTRPKEFSGRTHAETTDDPYPSRLPGKGNDNEEDEEIEVRRQKRKKKKKKRMREEDQDELMSRMRKMKHKTDRYEILKDGSTDTDEEIHAAIEGGRKKHAEVKQLNIYGEDSQSQDIEDRIAKLEQTTERSLYNIEALLRNAVFSRASVQPPGGFTSRGGHPYRDYNQLN